MSQSVMRFLQFLCVSLLALLVYATPTRRAVPQGIDVSDFRTSVNWATVKANGISFAYTKATEGTTFISDQFAAQYNGAFNFHGAVQADFFVAHGGGWSGDGLTFPGTLDIENNPNSPECYGLSQSAMVSWIQYFVTTYHAKTTRFSGSCFLRVATGLFKPDIDMITVIYTTTSWWISCTGNSAAFAANSPLWIAHFASQVGALPAGWSFYTFWQFADSGPNPGDADVFNGDATGLSKLATG